MSNYTILVVDYEPRSLEVSRAPLAAAGFKVETAADGVAGLEAYNRIKPDLVLIEAMLPKKHGFEVCQTIKSSPAGKQTPVLITTAVYKGRKYRTQALHIYGCDDYVEKPIAPEALVELCRRFLKDSTPAAATAMPVATATPAAATAAAATAAPSQQKTNSPAASFVSSAVARTSTGPRASAAAAIVSDLTEQEIMDRLDAILPDDGLRRTPWTDGSAAPELHPEPMAVAPLPEEAPIAPPVPESVFAQMGTPESEFDPIPELDSVLAGLLPTSPAVPEQSRPVAPAAREATSPQTESESNPQVVSFDPARKRKRQGSRGPAPSPAAATETQAISMADMLQAHPEAPAAVAQPEVRERPAAKVAAAAAEPVPVPEVSTRKAGVPLWVWGAVACIVAVGALYLFFGSSGSQTTPEAPAVARQAAVAQLPRTSAAENPPAPKTTVPAVSSSEKPPLTAATRDTARNAEPVVQPQAPPKPAQGSATAQASAPKPVPERVEKAPPVLAPKSVPVAAQAAAAPPTVQAQPRNESPAPATPPAVVQQAQPAVTEPIPAAAKPVPQAPAEAAPAAQAAPVETAAAAPKTTVARGTLMDLDAVDVQPVGVKRVLPAYTERARTLGQRGLVFLNILVDENGRVTDVQVIQGIPDSDLNDAAAQAARGWVYQPATKDGVPVKVWKFEKLTFGP